MVAIVAEGVTMVMAVTVAIVVVQMLNTALIANHQAAQRINTALIANQHRVIAPAVVVPMRNPLASLIMAANHRLAQDHPSEIKYARSLDMH
jgi:hypothetical protein